MSLFGLSITAGFSMFAGIVYTLLVIRQKSLKGPIIAHGVTNLGLGIYLIGTESLNFW